MVVVTFICAAVLALSAPLDALQVHTPPIRNARRIKLPVPPVQQWCPRRATQLNLLKGLVPTIDDEINRELAEVTLTPKELFERERSEGASVLDAIKAVLARRKQTSGDYENKFKLLSDFRSYSNKELLDKDHFMVPPVLDDLNQKLPEWNRVLWVRSYFRLGVYVCAYLVFPIVCRILDALVEVSPEEFDIINEQFTPGIGILYGTFVALTLDILYERQGKVQENASVEASLLSQVTQNVLSLFRNQPLIAREASQIIADQIRIIVYRSRGSEMLNIMRSDPYARLLSLIDHFQRDKDSFTPHEEALIDCLRGEIPALMEARARRLSDEASALPPTHFIVLLTLTALSLIGFTAATLSITDANGNPPLESGMVFAALSAVYILFYNFCKDMNDPFEGVYQIKRSSAASYLLQMKWIIGNQPFGNDIKFDTRGLPPVFDRNEAFAALNDSNTIGIPDASILANVPVTSKSSETAKESPSVESKEKELIMSTVPSTASTKNNGEATALQQVKETRTTAAAGSTSLSTNGEVVSTTLDTKSAIDEKPLGNTAVIEAPVAQKAQPVTFSSSPIDNSEIATNGATSDVQSTTSINDAIRQFVPENFMDRFKQTSQRGESESSSTSDKVELSISLDEPPEQDSYISVTNQDDTRPTVSNAGVPTKVISRFQQVSGFGNSKQRTSSKGTLSLVSPSRASTKNDSSSSNEKVRLTSNYFRNMGGFKP